MSRTRRIYNNPVIKKAQRYNIDDGELHAIVGIPFTRRSSICMGRCPICRDPNREPKVIRKRAKEQFRFELKTEFAAIEDDNSYEPEFDVPFDECLFNSMNAEYL